MTAWVRELADRFHGFYHDCYVIGDGVSAELTQARLWLVESVRIGLAIGLDLLGVSAPERMGPGDRRRSVRRVSAPLPRRLLPDTAAVDADAVPCRSAAATCSRSPTAFGTPLFVYDEAHLRARCREAVDVFGDGVAYATKAFLCLAMARLAHEEGMHLDVATGGELHVALAAGVPRRAAGPPRQQQERRRAARAREVGVGRIVVDSFDELDRLEALHADDGIVPDRARARRRPGSRPTPTSSCGPARSTPSSASASRPARPSAALDRARQRPAMELVGVHAHIGSQVFVADFFHQAIEVIAPWVLGLGLAELSIGGGLGVAYVVGEDAPSITRVGPDGARRLRAPRASPSRGHGRAGPGDRGAGRRHALPRRHDQGDPRACGPTSRSTAA